MMGGVWYDLRQVGSKLHFSLGFVIGYLNWRPGSPSFYGHMPTIVGTFYCILEGGLSSP